MLPQNLGRPPSWIDSRETPLINVVIVQARYYAHDWRRRSATTPKDIREEFVGLILERKTGLRKETMILQRLEKEKRKIQEASSYENKFIFLLKVFFHKKTRTDQVKYKYIFKKRKRLMLFKDDLSIQQRFETVEINISN